MALGATIYKVELQVSDLDRHYYQSHSLTVAQHPSETDQRMMVRILVFALNASDRLQFCKGLSTDDEPDLWVKNLRGDIDKWIEVGQPSVKRVKKACQQSAHVCVYTFSGHSAEMWWQQNHKELAGQRKLEIIRLPGDQLGGLTGCVERSMALQCTIQEGLIWFGNAQNVSEIKPEGLKVI